jgi:hypothetical protein
MWNLILEAPEHLKKMTTMNADNMERRQTRFFGGVVDVECPAIAQVLRLFSSTKPCPQQAES